MMLICIIGLIGGIMTGLRFKVLALIPVNLTAACFAVGYVLLSHCDHGQAVAGFVLWSVVLQASYVLTLVGVPRLSRRSTALQPGSL